MSFIHSVNLLLSVMALGGMILWALVAWSNSHRTWRCFHCGFMTSNFHEAEAHFGEEGDYHSDPLCKFWYPLTKEQRMGEYQRLSIESERERNENADHCRTIENLEYQVGSLTDSIRSRFKGCRDINDVWHLMDSLKGELLATREREEAALFWVKKFSGTTHSFEWLSQVLAEHKYMQETLTKVYPEISGGRIHSTATTAEGVINAVEAHYKSKYEKEPAYLGL